MREALFLDLGGTLLRLAGDRIHTGPDGRGELLPNVAATLRARSCELVFVVTNQSEIEEGDVARESVASLVEQVDAAAGGVVTDWWACPFKDSEYRKPRPGMLLGLADKHFVDLARSTMVGDSESDRACARAAGVGRFVPAGEFFRWPHEA